MKVTEHEMKTKNEFTSDTYKKKAPHQICTIK